MSTSQVDEAWPRIERWLAAHAPGALASLRPGADPAAVADAQQREVLAEFEDYWDRHYLMVAATNTDWWLLVDFEAGDTFGRVGVWSGGGGVRGRPGPGRHRYPAPGRAAAGAWVDGPVQP